MQIDVLQTPNPDTLKFSIGKTLVENGSLEFKNKQEGKNYEVVTSLFDLGSVDLVFFGSDFISVKKKASVDWSVLTDKVRKVIIEKIDNNFKPIVVEN
ncbi:MAG: NifU N-terminal domain-containing protein, partial [Candidatus Fonsibacter sp.]